ncbi:hypothetical protein SAMN05192574_103486 [Mucilaginibacter gossypiicola]|uniref:Uncharacterized protein n=1 Tax=Mucilaginibacter gossypiicola TaxID=551995 RepID=A0A1H8HGU9_9SPHI|nr:hypothetical protein [Mucilaginibacter gossypiicola]SEN54768.1 hypothetical protein SAMN05192574_103486 [Mucilaginibacter gossypiicola]
MAKIVMDERKWTLVVMLLIVSGVAIYNLRNYIDRRSEHSLSFKNCNVKYYYITKEAGLDGDVNRVAENRLARCLCRSYEQKKDTAIARKIMEIYRKNTRDVFFNTSHVINYNKLDSVIKHREMVFDTLVLID